MIAAIGFAYLHRQPPGIRTGHFIRDLKEATVKTLKFAGALAIAFALGGVTTIFAVPRPAASVTISATSISPEDMTRNVGALPVTFVENYM
jgi:hypothetical protein